MYYTKLTLPLGSERIIVCRLGEMTLPPGSGRVIVCRLGEIQAQQESNTDVRLGCFNRGVNSLSLFDLASDRG